MTTLGSTAADGRLARGARTRLAVVDALLALLEKGDPQPSGARVAALAGISERALFLHFPDLDSLFAAAADRQMSRLAVLAKPLPADGPVEQRLAAFVRRRARLFEAVRPVRRAAVRMEPFSTELARRLARGRSLAEAEILHIFEPELACHAAKDREELLHALATAAEWSTWEALREHRALSVERARLVMTRMLSGLLGLDQHKLTHVTEVRR